MRGLRRSPGFAVTAIATLAIGLGVNTAVFCVTNAVLFKGFPLVRGNDRILYIAAGKRGMTARVQGGVSYPDFEDWQAQAKSFEGMALVRGERKIMSGSGDSSEAYLATTVTANTFQLLGVKPILGRSFTPADARSSAPPVVILRYRTWQRRFGKDPDIVGRSVRLSGVPATVIGVMPRGFSFPYNQDLWTPLAPRTDLKRSDRNTFLFAVGRLADGATIESVRTEMETIGRRLANAYPDTNQDIVPWVGDFNDYFIGAGAARAYEALWGAVGFVLLIACANVGNLLLGRGMGRSREIGIRYALGAGRRRILRQLLVESMLLSSLGGLLGWWIGEASVRIYALSQGSNDWASEVLGFTMDYRVLAYLVALTLGVGLLFGFAPALRLSELDVNADLKEGGRGATEGRRGRRVSALLISGELALAVVLLAGAGVMIRSFLNVYTADAGVSAGNVLATGLPLPRERYPSPEAQVSFYDRLRAHLATVPGVESVAFASAWPSLNTFWHPSYEIDGVSPVGDRYRPSVSALVISPDYFRTLGATVLSGRGFSELDRASSLPVVIVNQQFADRNWPGENPLGKRLRLFGGKAAGGWLTVVGVASNIVQDDPTRQKFDPLIYVAYTQRRLGFIDVLVRTRVPPESLVTELRRAVHTIDPALPLRVQPLQQTLQASYLVPARNISALLMVFAGIALLLASVGLYAVIAHAVTLRTQEIGVRTAMGARASDIGKLVFRLGILPLGAGLGIGLVASSAMNRFLESQLVGVSPADPITLVAASAVLLGAAALGCLIPARRAMRVDPVIALRHE